MLDFIELPPVTKAYLVSSAVITFGVYCDILSPLQLFFSYKHVFQQGQIWRLFTTFLYWGPLSLDYFFHLFFFIRYSQMLEGSTFHGRHADYVWLLIVSAATLVLLFPLSPTPFLASPLSSALTYLWSRENPSIRLSLFGIITITAPYLPYVLCLFTWVVMSTRYHHDGFLSGPEIKMMMGDAMGIFTGQWWYFWTVVWPRERSSGGRNWLKTPTFLVRWFDPPERLAIIAAQERQRKLDLRLIRE